MAFASAGRGSLKGLCAEMKAALRHPESPSKRSSAAECCETRRQKGSGLAPTQPVFLIDLRGEDPRVPIKPLHKMTQAQAITELEAVGLRWVETRDILPTQHFMVFEKPAEG
jgi:hypothetical protein